MKKVLDQSHLIDLYIQSFEDYQQERMKELRSLIKRNASDALEIISYQMPTFYLKGILVHFAAYKSHLGFYPGSEAINVFKEQLSVFKCSKGTIQLKWEDELPSDLIRSIVMYRKNQNLEK